MFLFNLTREQLLAYLPKGGEIAEIGVAAGTFSRMIQSVVEPYRLHLIDPWEHQDRPDYDRDLNNVPDNEHANRYNEILSYFSPLINTGHVKVHRSYSTESANTFSDS